MVWFRKEPMPVFLKGDLVVFGGTSLLREFTSRVGDREEGGTLAISVPFIGRGLQDFLPLLTHLPHARTDLRMVVRRSMEHEAEELMAFPWRSAEVAGLAGLHAKVYAFSARNGGGCALVGSHNLTRSGSAENLEVGALVVAPGPGPLAEVVEELVSRVTSRFATAGGASSFIMGAARETEAA